MKSASHGVSKIILYIVIALVVLGIIAGIVYAVTPGATQEKYIATPVSRMDLTQTVTATGETAPDQESILAFDGLGGTVDLVNVAVGDHVTKGELLATLESDILQSGLEGAQAGVAGAEAQLAELEQGAKPADIAVYSQKVADAETALSSTIHDAYLKVQDAIENQTDTFFTNAVSSNPVINVPTENLITQSNINEERLEVGGDIGSWQNALTSDTPNQVTPQAEAQASTTLADAKNFLSNLGAIMDWLSPANSGFTQSQIEADIAVVNSAATEVNAGVSEYTGALSDLNEASSALTLEQSSSTPATIAAQEAAVAAAQAQADSDQAQISHSELVAPFDGIVTDVEATKGDVFDEGVPAITVISDGPMKIEVQVSETDVAKLALGDVAAVTLDAYGSGTEFPAVVTAIDPGQTVANGVNSYQVTLHFLNADARILSGMTANISIVTATATDAIAVPADDIITQGTQTFVMTQGVNGQFSEQQVMTGITGSNGYVQIVSGLSDGTVIASL